ncbi:MAG: hypothetical protein IMY76_04960 [Chloroflexi bacterium]|nr:hypothetical protein [Chloroflexota bacterium]
MKHKHQKRGKNLFGPFILITIGIAFLFNNLGLLGSDLWSTLVQLWPVLLIALGLNALLRHRNIIDPVLTIGIGLIILATNFGLLSWASWITVLRLWPILLIAIGLEIFFGRKSLLLSSVAVLLTLSILVAGLWFSGTVTGVEGIAQDSIGTELLTEQIAQPLEGAETAILHIESSVGALYIEALSSSDNLIEGTINTGKNEVIRQYFKQDDGEATYVLDSDLSIKVPFINLDKNQYTWDLELNRDTPLDLNLNLGVGESVLDLAHLTISDLDLNIGVGQVTLDLPAGDYKASIEGGVGKTVVVLPSEGNIRLDVQCGVGEIVIRVPEGMALKAHIDRGIAGLTIPSSYAQNGDVYTSPGYEDAENRIELYLDQGIGNIAIREQ